MSKSLTEASQLEAALHFARRGWPVFPCSRANKRPLLGRDRDENDKPINGTGGVSKATCDEGLIRTWWSKWPTAMIGVSVGKAGMIVIDFDPRTEELTDPATGEVLVDDDGKPQVREWTLEELKAAVEAMMGEPMPVSLAVRTPSGGVHVYYQMPGGKPIGNRGNLPDHVDVRGDGGYVILPPSFCDGDVKNARGPYRWLRGDPAAPIAALPASLVEILRAPSAPVKSGQSERGERVFPASPMFLPDIDESHRRYAMAALDRAAAELASTPQGGGRHGGRNKGAYAAAFNLGGFVATGALSESLVRSVLVDIMRGFDPAGIERNAATIDRGMQEGKERPHDLSAVGARTTRGRDSARSASLSEDDRPAAPLSAYDDDAGAGSPAPVAGGIAAFQNGTVAIDTPSGGGGRIAPERDAAVDRECGLYAMTDLGNAERFKRRHGWRFRFCNELGWFVWDGRRWELLSEEKDKVPGKVTLAVFDTVRAIGNEAAAVEASGVPSDLSDDATDDEREANARKLNRFIRWKGSGDDKIAIYHADELRAHAKSSEGAQRIGSVANLAKAFPDVAIRADAMDADRMAINVLNGTLRIVVEGNKAALVLDKHRPTDLISKLANVIYDPTAKADRYDAFLAAVQPDPAMRRFLHQWGGLSLTGDIGEQKLVFHHGGGRNGKSTLNDLWATIAGDYGASVAIETFLDQGRGRKGGEATPDLARLPGVRFLRTSEPEKGAKLAEALIKLVTGGEPIDARHLNKGFFTFLPSFKLSVQGNHKPKITGHDDGIWRRMLLVPWAVQIAKEDVDAKLPEKLRDEASGVLNRLLAGLLDWKMEGLITPDAVANATAKYREQSDQLGRFLTECTVHDGTGFGNGPCRKLPSAGGDHSPDPRQLRRADRHDRRVRERRDPSRRDRAGRRRTGRQLRTDTGFPGQL